ncbi:MAG: DsbA family protein, partial [Actinomycetota bacterium]
MADVAFWFDPVCPFAWMTSKWVRLVAEQREYDVEWRLISLRLLNSHIDYDAHFPPEYEEGHTSGLRMLRVAAKARA